MPSAQLPELYLPDFNKTRLQAQAYRQGETQNALHELALRRDMETRNALTQYLETGDMAPVAKASPETAIKLLNMQREKDESANTYKLNQDKMHQAQEQFGQTMGLHRDELGLRKDQFGLQQQSTQSNIQTEQMQRQLKAMQTMGQMSAPILEEPDDTKAAEMYNSIAPRAARMFPEFAQQIPKQFNRAELTQFVNGVQDMTERTKNQFERNKYQGLNDMAAGKQLTSDAELAYGVHRGTTGAAAGKPLNELTVRNSVQHAKEDKAKLIGSMEFMNMPPADRDNAIAEVDKHIKWGEGYLKNTFGGGGEDQSSGTKGTNAGGKAKKSPQEYRNAFLRGDYGDPKTPQARAAVKADMFKDYPNGFE